MSKPAVPTTPRALVCTDHRGYALSKVGPCKRCGMVHNLLYRIAK